MQCADTLMYTNCNQTMLASVHVPPLPLPFPTERKEEEKTTPLGINSMRSPVLYRAAQALSQHLTMLQMVYDTVDYT